MTWRSGAFWDALSPVTYKKELYQLGGVYKIDPLLLAAIIRAESHFLPLAKSKAGAIGLMQLMPATAKEMVSELGLQLENPADLYREEMNIKLGTHYFAKMLKLSQGNLPLALASYNAGRANVLAWKIDPYGMNEASVIRAIPVAETKAYVARVLDTYRTFKSIQRVKRWLGGES